jgi:hypothetical protein
MGYSDVMAPEHRDGSSAVLSCADCGLAIADNEDVTCTLDANGDVRSALHSDAFHRELVGDEDDGFSPYAYYELRRARAIARHAGMYSRRNCTPVAPGRWETNDGEYAFTRTVDGWIVRRCDTLTGTGIVGIVSTLNAGMALAGRHYTQS